MEKSSIANLPTEFGNFKIIVYKINNIEYPVLFKQKNKKTPLIRIHSECATGDIFCSLKCDCKQQLHYAMHEINKNEDGFLIYARGHEGRGIGLFNKINAYSLQDEGFNTIEANEKLGFKSECRSYENIIKIIKDLSLKNFILLTNNPEKIDSLKNANLNFKTKNIKIMENEHNTRYITDKKNLMGHSIEIITKL